jgi:hypothetical protein
MRLLRRHVADQKTVYFRTCHWSETQVERRNFNRRRALTGEIMATILRQKRGPRQLGPYRRHELLTGEAVRAEIGYTGYASDGKSDNAAGYISDEIRADWQEHRSELIAFWKSGQYTTAEIFADSKPWLFVRGDADTLPWAAEQFDEETASAK